MAEQRTQSEEVRDTTRPCQLNRRRFLKTVGIGGASVVMLAVPGRGMLRAMTTPLDEQRVGSVSELETDEPRVIMYPDAGSACVLVKLGTPAGGGVGPDEDIVAFSAGCTHMGMSMLTSYNAEYKGLGPCPSHLTRFDLTRYGIVVSGHATESLPQVLLEVRNGEIYATGMRGLVFGRTGSAT